jgi:hypothetical protein
MNRSSVRLTEYLVREYSVRNSLDAAKFEESCNISGRDIIEEGSARW